MLPFRLQVPKHQKNRRVCKLYYSYKKSLRNDFLKRCGYCNDLDINRIRSYVIDHFVPQKPTGWTHSIPQNYYYNLVYSCPFCNGAKLNEWPTKDAKIHHDGTKGFVMPTKKNYSSYFRRLTDGSIIVYNNSVLGQYIYDTLNFWHDIHALNWKFEKILEQEKILEALLVKVKDRKLKAELQKLKIERLEIVDSIHSLYND